MLPKLWLFFQPLLIILILSHLCHAKNLNNEEPTIQIVVLIHPYNKVLHLPYLFGSLESQVYPKHRLRISLITERIFFDDYNREEDEEQFSEEDQFEKLSLLDDRIDANDRTIEVVKKWVRNNRYQYADIDLSIANQELTVDYESDSVYWTNKRFRHIIDLKNHELYSARQNWADFVLFLDTDVVLTEPFTFSNLTQVFADQEDALVVAPVLNSVGSYSNFWGAMDKNGYYQRSDNYLDILERKQLGVFQVPVVHTCFMVNLKKRASRLLSFDPIDVESGDPNSVPLDDMIAFARTAQQSSLQFHVDNRHIYGFIPLAVTDAFHQHSSDAEAIQALVDLELDSLLEGPPFPVSSSLEQYVEPLVEKPDTIGVDQVYIVNLKRRPERKQRMKRVLNLLQIKALFWEATDGRTINREYLDQHQIETLPGYLDPYHQRPVTFGEIGCFLSHYRIWENAYRNNYSKIIVFEDDTRFVHNFRSKWAKTLANFDKLDGAYDFLYLGRKLGADHPEELRVGDGFVEPHYSYWTIGYMLTNRGVEKLLHSNPLRRLLPVDEYLPLMFGVHSNETLLNAFGPFERVRSLSVSPLLVTPTHYVGDALYISDTEDSHKILSENNEKRSQDHYETEQNNDVDVEENGNNNHVETTEIHQQPEVTPVLRPPPPTQRSMSHFEL